VFNVGPSEVLLILLIALIVFGPKRLPEIGKTVGKGLREFRQATQGVKDELARTMDFDDDDEDDVPAKRAGSPPSAQPAPHDPNTEARGEEDPPPPMSGEAATGT
jgi:sec-independent protein translocase protein TatA